MNKKPLSEWTLGELKRFCSGRECTGCQAYSDATGCILMDTSPGYWNLPEKIRLKEIVSNTDDDELLGLLCEECAELIQAAQKLRRVQHGTTPMDISAALKSLREEMADTQVVMDAVITAGMVDFDRMSETATEKIMRWYKRTFRAEQE